MSHIPLVRVKVTIVIRLSLRMFFFFKCYIRSFIIFISLKLLLYCVSLKATSEM